MADQPKREGKMTVFRTDRHEDFAAIILVLLVVGGYLFYMAFIKDHVVLTAPSDGSILTVDVAPGAAVKAGDLIFTYEAKIKKYVDGQLKEEVKKSSYKAKTPGLVAELTVKPGDAMKKGKTKIMKFNHEKGSLP